MTEGHRLIAWGDPDEEDEGDKWMMIPEHLIVDVNDYA